MGHSSLLGADHAPPTPSGRDTASLGPGDSSDSGSDLAGLDELDTQDPGAPLDVSLREDRPHSLLPPDSAGGSDAAGTGERRSAASDGGAPDGRDIGVDHVFTPGGRHLGGRDAPDDEDKDLAFVDEAVAGNPLDDEEDDEDEARRQRHPRDHSPSQPPEPARPNPEPDLPEPVPGDDDDGDLPIDRPDAAEHRPDRTAALLRKR